MQQFLPDAESITELWGPDEACGFKVEMVHSPCLGGYGLRMQLGTDSTVLPVFPLSASEMDSPKAAARWMAQLRDNHLNQLVFLLKEQ